MAIGKSTTGHGFKGVCNYVLNKKDAEFLYARGVVTENPNLIAKQMRSVADMRSIKNPVFHAYISLKNKERGTDEQWKLAADAFLKNMGFDLDQTQYIVARHTDAGHDHVHIVANRVMLNNVVVSDFQHKQRTHQATRAAELAAGFTKYESKKDRQIRMQETRSTIDAALKSSKNLLGKVDYTRFKIELGKLGIELVESRSKTTDRLFGISYKTADHHYKGSQLGKDYSLGGLQKRGLQTEQSKTQNHSQPRTSVHDPASGTQARVDAQKARLHGHTNQAKANAREDENKRLQTIRHKQREEEDELE